MNNHLKDSFLLASYIIIFSFATCKPEHKNTIITSSQNSVYTYKTATEGGIGKLYLGRQIAHVMGYEGSEWLERNNRNEEENTRLAISMMPLEQNSVVADIGAGTGFYSFQIAQKITTGKVYAVDIQDEVKITI